MTKNGKPPDSHLHSSAVSLTERQTLGPEVTKNYNTRQEDIQAKLLSLQGKDTTSSCSLPARQGNEFPTSACVREPVGPKRVGAGAQVGLREKSLHRLGKGLVATSRPGYRAGRPRPALGPRCGFLAAFRECAATAGNP